VLQEFREFIDRGSFIDLAVGFVMGAAVTAVVQTIVDRLIMPAIGLVFGEPDFDNVLTFGGVGPDGVPVGSVGAVFTALLNFLIVAFVLFLIIRAYNRSRRQQEPEADPEDVVLLREIRDLLRGAGRGMASADEGVAPPEPPPAGTGSGTAD
jgi:large conductance mechanosensitive channel